MGMKILRKYDLSTRIYIKNLEELSKNLEINIFTNSVFVEHHTTHRTKRENRWVILILGKAYTYELKQNEVASMVFQ